MAKMDTVAHFSCEMPGATPDEMRQAERLMRSPMYMETMLAIMNAVPSVHSKAAGLHKPFTISGSIHQVDHAA